MMLGLLSVAALATMLSALFSGRQPATVALDVSFSIARLLLPLLIVLLIQELLSREFDKRYYLASLAYPQARESLLLGRFAAVFVLVIGVLLLLCALQAGLVKFISGFYPQATPVALGWPYIVAVAFLALDLIVLVALSTLLAVIATTPSFVLIGTLGFMVVARSYGAVVELISRDHGLVSNTEDYRAGLGLLGYLVPDLGALDIRMVALYGRMDFIPADWPWILFSSFFYAVALLALAVWALQRKRFS
ncbi:MAG: hypothetical protein C0452_20985 [Pseudomonas sp.]|nr:hypothetical protein [Pseudomonas sp.]